MDKVYLEEDESILFTLEGLLENEVCVYNIHTSSFHGEPGVLSQVYERYSFKALSSSGDLDAAVFSNKDIGVNGDYLSGNVSYEFDLTENEKAILMP